ncbi:hypothetical protein SBBP1_200002 [Burkholderiales bacterium]|nr:hypothetical protein SBBP1_200002 [Burkholderiales bacterium]
MGHNPSLEQADDAVRKRQAAIEVLFHQDRGRARRLQVLQRVIDAIDRLGRQPQRNLVQQQQARIGHQRPADRRRLLFAPREMAGFRLPDPGQLRKGLPHSIKAPGARSARSSSHAEVLLDRHSRKQPAPLRNQCDAVRHSAMGRQSRDFGAIELNPTPGHRVNPGNYSQQGGLTGAVGADQGKGLTFGDFEADATHGGQEAVNRTQTFNAEQGHARLHRDRHRQHARPKAQLAGRRWR